MKAKALPFLVLALFVVSGLGAADGGDPSSEAEDAFEEHCEENPEDERCRQAEATESGNETAPDDENRTSSDAGNETAEEHGPEEYCDDPEPRHADECEKYEEYEDRQLATGQSDRPEQAKQYRFRHVEYVPDLEGNAFYDYTVDGVHILDEGHYLGAPEEFEAERHGATIELEWDDDRLRIHDNPTGLLTFKADRDGEGAFLIDFDDNATITLLEDGASVRLGDRQAILVAPDAEWLSEDTVVVDGFLSLHMPETEEANGPETEERNQRAAEVTEAIQERRLGAQVTLRPADADDATDTGLEVGTFDDVEINVTTPAAITSETPLSVLVSAELPEGRTIVLDVDRSLLTGPDLDLRYFDVHDDGTRTEVVFRQADSLEDILDPDDDAGQPEYWVVEDANGLQVMVSVPHWSVHEITLASIGEFVTQPSVLVGAVAGAAGAVLATVGLFWPRRREP